jgi:glycosyltransferase involved in cell wall biosynthesis
MKKVLYICPFSHIGGGEISLLTILKALDRGKYDAHIICYARGPFVDRARSLGFPVLVFERGPLYTDFFLIARIAYYIMKNDISLVHVNSLDICAGIAARCSRIPLVGHLRVIMPFTWRDRLFVRMAARVIAVSKAAVDNFCQASLSRGKNFVIIPPAVEIPALVKPASLREEFRVPPAAYLVGAVGRIDMWKGYEYFIDAAAAISKERPDFYFILAGMPSETDAAERGYFESLKTHVARSGLSDRFFFIGFRDDPLGVIAACDLIAVTSYLRGGYKKVVTEGFGRVAAEAMAVGVPVVASNAGGLSEIIEDKKTGLLVPPQNSEALYRAILKIAGDEDLQRLLVCNARAKFEALYTVARQRSALESLYGKVLSEDA